MALKTDVNLLTLMLDIRISFCNEAFLILQQFVFQYLLNRNFFNMGVIYWGGQEPATVKVSP